MCIFEIRFSLFVCPLILCFWPMVHFLYFVHKRIGIHCCINKQMTMKKCYSAREYYIFSVYNDVYICIYTYISTRNIIHCTYAHDKMILFVLFHLENGLCLFHFFILYSLYCTSCCFSLYLFSFVRLYSFIPILHIFSLPAKITKREEKKIIRAINNHFVAYYIIYVYTCF